MGQKCAEYTFAEPAGVSSWCVLCRMLDLAVLQKLCARTASSVMSSPANHIPLDQRRLLSSTWHVLEQPPPPSLREILGAYRSKGDGDRDMLIAMLNAKGAEDQRMAAIASLHRTLLDLYTTDPTISIAPLHHHPLSSPPTHPSKERCHTADFAKAESAHKHVPVRDPPPPSQPPRKRQRYSRSPVPSSHRDVRSSLPSSRDLPPSPYSSRSDSEECSPRSRASMAIGSLLSSGATGDSVPEDPTCIPELSKTRLPPSAIRVSV